MAEVDQTQQQIDAAARAKQKAIDDWLPITGSRNAKWWYSTFHNVCAMVGSGVLALPFAMSEMGSWSCGVCNITRQSMRWTREVSWFIKKAIGKTKLAVNSVGVAYPIN